MAEAKQFTSEGESENLFGTIAIPDQRSHRTVWFVLVIIGVIVLIAFVSLGLSDGVSDDAALATTVARLRDLTAVVTESGTLQTRKSIDYESEVDDDITIQYLVPEGTFISAEDVKNGKILARLDKAPLENKLSPSQKEVMQAQDLHTEAKEEYVITRGQNESDIAAGLLAVEFAKMDMQRSLGKAFADRIVQKLSNDPNATLDPPDEDVFQDPNALGASQQIHDKLQDAITLAKARLTRARDKWASTDRLYAVKYASRMELEGDALEVESSRVQYRHALTELELFLTYDFPKDATRLFSDYREELRELDRIRARARAREAQARSKVAAKEAQLNWAQERVCKYEKQIETCVIRATAPGLVIHASGRDIFERVIPEREIREGMIVRRGQKIITMPDTSEMVAQLGVSETAIHKVRKEQQATITIDAFPDQKYQGKVSHVSQLPNPQGPFSGGIKVYLVRVDVVNPDEGLKPGMSAKAEIVVEHLSNVLAIPIQCIVSQDDKNTCYVKTNGQVEEREVATGSYSETFVHITSGLAEGESILLNPFRYSQTSHPARFHDSGHRPDKKTK